MHLYLFVVDLVDSIWDQFGILSLCNCSLVCLFIRFTFVVVAFCED